MGLRRDRRGRLWARDGRAMARPCWRVIYGPAALYEGQVQIGGEWRYCDCSYRCRKCGACLGCERKLVIDAWTGEVDLDAARCVDRGWHEAEIQGDFAEQPESAAVPETAFSAWELVLKEISKEIARQIVERAATMRANGLSDEEIRAVLIGG